MRGALLVLAWCLAGTAAAAAAVAASEITTPCSLKYIAPATQQCELAYKGLGAGSSPRHLSLAFDSCARSQDAALACLTSKNHQVHVIALGALYRSVSLQADIAMYARQFRVATPLLQEKLSVIDIAQREARPGDTTPAKERAATERVIGDARAGECTERALASAAQQYALAKAHNYVDLAALLKIKYADYQTCARLVTSRANRSYVEYVGLVALEESGRAAQAASHQGEAERTYRDCIGGVAGSSRYASARVKGYLATVGALCKGRLNGTYRVDQPAPIDAPGGNTFQPMTLPKR